MRLMLKVQENYTMSKGTKDQEVHPDISIRLTPLSTLIISNQAKSHNKGVMSKGKTNTKKAFYLWLLVLIFGCRFLDVMRALRGCQPS